MTKTNEATAAVSPAGHSYDGRKSGLGAVADPGLEIRVRQVRRRTWSTEDRLRIVRETLEPCRIASSKMLLDGVVASLKMLPKPVGNMTQIPVADTD